MRSVTSVVWNVTVAVPVMATALLHLRDAEPA